MTRTQVTHLLVLGALFALSACTKPSSTAPPRCTVTGVSVSASPNPIIGGASSTLTASVDSFGPACANAVTWSLATGFRDASVIATSDTTATFTATVANSYAVVATSQDDPNKSGTVTVLPLIGAPPPRKLWE